MVLGRGVVGGTFLQRRRWDDDTEHWDFTMTEYMDIRTVRTRKPHRCFACAREIPKGAQMRVIVVKDGGDFNRMYWCAVCQEYWERYMHRDDEIMEGELRANDPDGDWEKLRLEVEAK